MGCTDRFGMGQRRCWRRRSACTLADAGRERCCGRRRRLPVLGCSRQSTEQEEEYHEEDVAHRLPSGKVPTQAQARTHPSGNTRHAAHRTAAQRPSGHARRRADRKRRVQSIRCVGTRSNETQSVAKACERWRRNQAGTKREHDVDAKPPPKRRRRRTWSLEHRADVFLCDHMRV